MLVTSLAILVTNIHYLFTRAWHQYSKDVNEILTPKPNNCHQLQVTNITITAIFHKQVDKLLFKQARKSTRFVSPEEQTGCYSKACFYIPQFTASYEKSPTVIFNQFYFCIKNLAEWYYGSQLFWIKCAFYITFLSLKIHVLTAFYSKPLFPILEYSPEIRQFSWKIPFFQNAGFSEDR